MKIRVILDRLAYQTIGLILTLIGLIPEKRAEKLAHSIAHIWYKYDKRHRSVALKNLTHAFDGEKCPEEIDALVRENFVHTARILFELG